MRIFLNNLPYRIRDAFTDQHELSARFEKGREKAGFYQDRRGTGGNSAPAYPKAGPDSREVKAYWKASKDRNERLSRNSRENEERKRKQEGSQSRGR